MIRGFESYCFRHLEARELMAKEYTRKSQAKDLTPAEMKGIYKEGFAEELEASAALSKYPAMADLKPRERMIMIAVSLGYSYRYIGHALGLSYGYIGKTVRRIDPHKTFLMDVEAKKAFLGERARRTALMALGAITPEKLSECSAPAAAKIAKTMMETSAIADRKELDLSGGKIKKVTVEFVQPSEFVAELAHGGVIDVDADYMDDNDDEDFS